MSSRESSLKISRILHAGYVFECGSTKIAFDPLFENPFSRNCHAFPAVGFDFAQIKALSLDAVFISHFHDDHCSLESLDLVDKRTPLYLFCASEELFALIRELGFTTVHALDLEVPVKIGNIEVTPHRALDESIDSILVVNAGGVKVLNVVDSWIGPETLETLVAQSPWDLVLWPFQTMRELEVLSPSRATPATGELPPEWLEQLSLLRPRVIVPSSCQFLMEEWSWYNAAFFPISYARFQREIEAGVRGARVVRMDPSTSIVLTSAGAEAASPLPWVRLSGENSGRVVDYVYDPTLRAPPTAEIARHFPALEPEQARFVVDYCTVDLIEKYNSLEPPADDYFSEPRLWRLSLYDHKGIATHFHYRLEDGKIAPLEKGARAGTAAGTALGAQSVGWSTEVPIARLFGALTEGESLTSIYVRINDRVFDPRLEAQVAAADLLEDPLLSCLSAGAAFAYQRAQLKRLRARRKDS